MTRPCRCAVCQADRWAHRLLGFVAGLIVAHLLWGVVATIEASRPAQPTEVRVDVSAPSSSAGRTGAPRSTVVSSLDPSPVPVASDAAGAVNHAERTPSPSARPSLGSISDVVVEGIASTYGPGWDGWIAWPDGPGYRLRVCGPAACRDVTSNDAGPSKAMQRAPYHRVIDLDVRTFERVCGVSWRMGLCPVVVTVLRVPR